MSRRLTLAVAVCVLRQILGHLKSVAVLDCPHPLLKQGENGLTALGEEWSQNGFGNQARQLLLQAESTRERGTGRRLFEVLKKRAVQWRTVLESQRLNSVDAASIDRYFKLIATGRNPLSFLAAYDSVTVRLRDVSSAASLGLRRAIGDLQELEQEVGSDLQSLENQEERYAESQRRQYQQSVKSAVTNARSGRWTAVLSFSVIAFVLVLILGYSLTTAIITACVACLLAFVVRRFGRFGVRNDADSPTPSGSDTVLTRPVPARLKDKLGAYGDAVDRAALLEAQQRTAEELLHYLEQSRWASEASELHLAINDLEAAIDRAWDAVPPGPYHEVHPGSIELLGKDLAALLTARRIESEGLPVISERAIHILEELEGTTFSEWLLTKDRSIATDTMIFVALKVWGDLTLEDAIALLRETPPSEALLIHWLQALVDVSCSASNLRRDVRLDPNLSVARLTIGLPNGTSDSLAPLISDRFAQAALASSSLPDAIEIIFDLRNLPIEALATHSLTKPYYDATGIWERNALWHFPFGTAETDSWPPKKEDTADQGNGHHLQIDLPGEMASVG